MATTGFNLKVENLRELDRALGKVSKGVRSELRKGIKEAGSVVADAAKEIATRNGLVESGNLVRKIAISATGSAVFVRANARRRGYNYASRYEFQDGGARAFLRPARDQKGEEAVEGVFETIERVLGREF